MDLSDESKRVLADEFIIAANLMNDEKDALRKVFYFSGAQGAVGRILNVEYKPELALMHLVLNTTYMALDSRLKSIISGAEHVVEIPPNIFEVLSKCLSALRSAILEDKNIYEALAAISAVGYVTTGNGYYLYKKGLLELV